MFTRGIKGLFIDRRYNIMWDKDKLTAIGYFFLGILLILIGLSELGLL